MQKDKAKYYNLYKRLGTNIRKARKRAKISQEELAFRISSARNYIGCIERAEKAPSLAIISEIAMALNINIEDLFKE
ncbi:helix-turn-helix transcriptional regulator [bacterium]|nr:helix-turn-helix transcriptional regulator [bacterium]